MYFCSPVIVTVTIDTICIACKFPTSGRKQPIPVYLKKTKLYFLNFFSNDKKKEEAEEKPPIVSFGQLVSYRTFFQVEVFNFDHWLNDSPTENSIVNSHDCPEWRACS